LNTKVLKDTELRISSDINGNINIIKGKESLFQTQNVEHLVQLFISPFPVKELQGIDPKLSEAVGAIKGLPFYFWGLDSV
jgi:hypothetical protein